MTSLVARDNTHHKLIKCIPLNVKWSRANQHTCRGCSLRGKCEITAEALCGYGKKGMFKKIS